MVSTTGVRGGAAATPWLEKFQGKLNGVPRASRARGQSQFWRPPPRPFVAA